MVYQSLSIFNFLPGEAGKERHSKTHIAIWAAAILVK